MFLPYTERLIAADPTLVPKMNLERLWFDQTEWFDDRDESSFPAGIDCDTGEFLAGVVALLKPMMILETGTRFGISTRYMATALPVGGKIVTLERCGYCYPRALKKFKHPDYADKVIPLKLESMNYIPPDGVMFDMLFLDSEPEYRYDELFFYSRYLRNGGIVAIHDLDCLDSPAFVTIRHPDIRERLDELKLQSIILKGDRATTLMQKGGPLWANKS